MIDPSHRSSPNEAGTRSNRCSCTNDLAQNEYGSLVQPGLCLSDIGEELGGKLTALSETPLLAGGYAEVEEVRRESRFK